MTLAGSFPAHTLTTDDGRTGRCEQNSFLDFIILSPEGSGVVAVLVLTGGGGCALGIWILVTNRRISSQQRAFLNFLLLCAINTLFAIFFGCYAIRNTSSLLIQGGQLRFSPPKLLGVGGAHHAVTQCLDTPRAPDFLPTRVTLVLHS